MTEIITKNWLNYFLDSVKKAESISLISPFISGSVVNHLLDNIDDKKVRLITRYNLNDFKSNVSSLSALKRMVQEGVRIRGIQGLHSKTYIFKNYSMIVTSANFTHSGFFKNYEFGVRIIDKEKINQSLDYFNKLWDFGETDLTVSDIKEWEVEIRESPANTHSNKLNNYGKLQISPTIKNKKAFIKFFGEAETRESLKFDNREQMKQSSAHFALTFSRGRGKPRRYGEGDIVYVARILHDGEYAIFGRGITRKHLDERDVASSEDIKHIPWIREYPIYVRTHSTKFIDTTMQGCPKMSELIEALDYDSFRSTQKRHLDGEVNINPRKSLSQQADIELSEVAAQWLEDKFNEAIETHGEIPNEFMSKLYWGSWKAPS